MTVFYQQFFTDEPTEAQFTAAFETNMWSKLVLVHGTSPSFSSTDRIAGWGTGVSPLPDTNTWSQWITNASPLYSAFDGSFPYTYISDGTYIIPGWQKLVCVRSQDSSSTLYLSVMALSASMFIWDDGARFYQGPKIQSNNGNGGAYSVAEGEDPFFFQNDLGFHIIYHSEDSDYCDNGTIDTCGGKYVLPLSTSPYNDPNRLIGNNGWAQKTDAAGDNIYGKNIYYGTTNYVGTLLRMSPVIFFQNGLPVLLNQPVTLVGTPGTTTRRIWSHNLLQPFNNGGVPTGQLMLYEYDG